MKRIKRFYDTVSLRPAASNQFQLLLDNKIVKTPLGQPLLLENEATANAIASEWELQDKFIVPNTMPMNTMIMTCIDVDSTIAQLAKWEQIARYYRTDTIRYPDEETGSKLFQLQTENWKSVNQFIKNRTGLTLSQSTEGIGVPAQAENEIDTIYNSIGKHYSPLRLTVLETAAKYLKSGSIATALVESAITPEEAYNAGYVEEIYQRKVWGIAEGDHDLSESETLLWLNGISVLSAVLNK